MIVFELPERNAYWDSLALQQFMEEFSLGTVVIHGCAYGLVARHGEDEGKPIKKPWKLATNNPVFASGILKRCVCKTTHVRCEGKETKQTEEYPPQLASAFHTLFKYIIDNDKINQKFNHSPPSKLLCCQDIAAAAAAK